MKQVELVSTQTQHYLPKLKYLFPSSNHMAVFQLASANWLIILKGNIVANDNDNNKDNVNGNENEDEINYN